MDKRDFPAGFRILGRENLKASGIIYDNGIGACRV